MGELFGEGGWVEPIREIVLGGVRPPISRFPGSFNSGVDRYNWG